MTEIDKQLLTFVLHFTTCTIFLCGILLWLQRGTSNKPRRYLAVTALASALAFLLRVLTTESGMPPQPIVLPVININLGFLALLLLYLYPIETISPGWLTWKRAFLLFLPWIFITLLLVMLPIQFRTLSSFAEIWKYAGEFNVWFRLFMLVIIVPYSFILFYVPHNWMKSSVSNKWIYFYTLGVAVIAVLFIIFMLTCSIKASIGHLVYWIFFILVVTYQELFLRIEVPAGRQEAPEPALVTTATTTAGDTPSSNPLLPKLHLLMDNEQLWRNPDLDLEELAARLKTNRTTLTQLLQQEGYSGYKEFINRRRINEFIKIADSGKLVNVQDTFFEVGFRSKMTALRYFRQYTGATPTEYIKKNIIL